MAENDRHSKHVQLFRTFEIAIGYWSDRGQNVFP